jgi:hypothetical protein
VQRTGQAYSTVLFEGARHKKISSRTVNRCHRSGFG